MSIFASILSKLGFGTAQAATPAPAAASPAPAAPEPAAPPAVPAAISAVDVVG